MSHKVQGRILLKPVYHNELPWVQVSIDHYKWNQLLDCPTWFEFEFVTARSQETLSVDFLNKKNSDTNDQQGLDKAVIIESVEFFNIHDQRFVWAGVYCPVYPEPWASQQTNLKQLLTNHNYLGWNGKWTLTFDVPVFTWMHKTLNLGWIYQ